MMKNIDRTTYNEILQEDILHFEKVFTEIGETDDKNLLYNKLFGKYKDPDKYTEWEINGVRFGADGICGLKYWIKYYDKPFNMDWIEDFNRMRSHLLIWPRHVQSINQRRMSCYKDRLDFALWDIEKSWSGIDSSVIRDKTESEKWIQKMKEKSFKEFMEKMDLSFMINPEGKVLNLETEDMRPFIDSDKFILSGEGYSRYLGNLLKIIS